MRSSSRSQSPFLKSILEKPKPLITNSLKLSELKHETDNKLNTIYQQFGSLQSRRSQPQKPANSQQKQLQNYDKISQQAIENLEKSITQVEKLKSTNTGYESQISQLSAELKYSQITISQQNNLIQKLSHQLAEKERQSAQERLTLQAEITMLKQRNQ
ncbi:hypothetical protein SS50377_27702 [Spironucleus salmonicida]|uniref:Uncharacterized protein n=1 Tax=Spironucleus salmonicida TaxID=348837 RepID=V6LPB9_9EUKA|nr:hypothetical protein SS50377_27702 [Spironucleus salmonicida]|eukprot:EST46522.1 Hypothetical protein SS50377_13327 [Spironucleus salmonicida]